MTVKQLYFVVLLTVIWLVLPGCSKKEDTPPPAPAGENTAPEETVSEDAPPAPEEKPVSGVGVARPVTFDTILDLWENGQRDQTVRLLLALNLKREGVFAPTSVFGMSEAEFVQLPQSQRQQVTEKATEAARSLKEIVKYMVEQAKQEGKTETYRQTLLALGQRLSAEDQLALIQLVGKAIPGYVEKELGSGN